MFIIDDLYITQSRTKCLQNIKGYFDGNLLLKSARTAPFKSSTLKWSWQTVDLISTQDSSTEITSVDAKQMSSPDLQYIVVHYNYFRCTYRRPWPPSWRCTVGLESPSWDRCPGQRPWWRRHGNASSWQRPVSSRPPPPTDSTAVSSQTPLLCLHHQSK